MSQFEDRHWTSADGLKLHFRDYAGSADKLPVICLHGLTRNARDFVEVAERIAPARRVLVPEMRGRGDSAYAKESESYSPLQYVQDVAVLLKQEGISRFVGIGTSMGGLMILLMGFGMPQVVAGALFNDIGPDLEMGGLAKIMDYVGQGRSFPTWMHAARALEETHGANFPDWGLEDWLAMAKRSLTLSSNGRVVFDYDMKIAEPFKAIDFDNQPDLWPGYRALAGKPVAVVRGALSDLFSEATFQRMGKEIEGVDLVTVPRVGHAPLLTEPEAFAAIDRLLARAD